MSGLFGDPLGQVQSKHHQPVVRGTRISVELVLELLAAGWTHEEILVSYPHLSEEDVRACLAYARELLREEKVYPLKTA